MQDLSRRTVLAGVCTTCVTAAVAACGHSEPAATPTAPVTPVPEATAQADPTTAPSSAVSTSASTAAAAGPALAATGDIPVGGGKIFADQKVVVTQPSAGTFKAFSAVCTHQGCTVTSISNGTINCPCHGSKFAIATGAVAGGPANTPLPEKQVTVSGTSISLA